jgi:hypothetical protein
VIGNGFNAWRDPWVPVLDGDLDVALSLRDVYLRAHNLSGLSHGLTPLEYDALLRFLPQVGALILRGGPPDQSALLEGRYPAESVSAFESTFDLSLFELASEKPFMQRWDLAPAELADAKKLHALNELFPHEPGPSSANWAIRLEQRNSSDLASLTLLLVVAWFHTKNGNGKDSVGSSVTKGSAGTWHVNPLSVFAIHPGSLGLSLLGNTPKVWLREDSSTAVYFQRNSEVPDQASAQPLSLYRCSYAKSMPLVRWVDCRPTDFELGPDRSIGVPTLGKDDKESLGNVHDSDHTRLDKIDVKKNTRTKLGAFGERLTSTAGLRRWFAEGASTKDSVDKWKTIERLASLDIEHWRIGVCSEKTDGKGTRWWCDWSELPLSVAGGDERSFAQIQTLVMLLDGFRKSAYVGAKQLAGGNSSMVDHLQSAVMRAAEPSITAALDQLAQNSIAQVSGIGHQMARDCVAAFNAATEPYLTPFTVREVAAVRSVFARVVRAKVYQTFGQEEQHAS